MKYSYRDIKNIIKKESDATQKGIAAYESLSDEEIECLYNFQKNGHRAANSRFCYADVGSVYFYIDVRLLAKYIGILGLDEGRKEIKYLQSLGFSHYGKINGVEILGTSEGLAAAQSLEKGVIPENVKPIRMDIKRVYQLTMSDCLEILSDFCTSNGFDIQLGDDFADINPKGNEIVLSNFIYSFSHKKLTAKLLSIGLDKFKVKFNSK
jgi:hypothetical protein